MNKNILDPQNSHVGDLQDKSRHHCSSSHDLKDDTLGVGDLLGEDFGDASSGDGSLQADTSNEKAMQDALKLLTYRPRSVYELILRLQKKGHSQASAAKTAAKLEEWGYLNDKKFAEDWIRNRLLNKPMGKIRLRQELKLKGISRDIIEAKLEEAFAEVSEFETASRLACSKLKKPDDWGKVAGLLKRRGFSYEIIRSIGLSLGLGPSELG